MGLGGVQNEKNVVVNVSAILNPTQLPSSKGVSNSRNLESSELVAASSHLEEPFSCPQVGEGAEGVVVGAEVDSSLLREKQRVMVDQFTANFIPPCADLLTKEEFRVCSYQSYPFTEMGDVFLICSLSLTYFFNFFFSYVEN